MGIRSFHGPKADASALRGDFIKVSSDFRKAYDEETLHSQSEVAKTRGE